MISLTADNAFATTSVYRSVLTGPSAWSQTDFNSQDCWSDQLSVETLHEIENAIQPILRDKKEMNRKDFSFPSLANDSIRLLRELKIGRGFVVLKGLPTQRSDDELRILYQLICSFLGTVLEQNAKGDQFYSVRDQGYDLNAFLTNTDKLRAAATRATLSLHTDSAPHYRGITPDIFALLALQPAKSGGETMLISAPTIHNVILQQYPEHLERLYQPYYFDRRVETSSGEAKTIFAPVFTYNGSLHMRYAMERILDGYKVAGVTLTSRDREALDCIENTAQRKELVVAFKLQRGEILLANNHFILHSRAAFEDHPQPERKRHLLRAWLRFEMDSKDATI